MRAELMVGWLMSVVLVGCGLDAEELPGEPQWWTTCGDPVCSGYDGPVDGVPVCTDQVFGDPCTPEGDSCDLQSACNEQLVCAVDDPTAQTGGCPISLRAFKKDIRYLDAPSLASAAQEALNLDLATWRYKDESDVGRTHLGFVIDDRPSSPAVAADGGHVDLYGYTSLAIAALQVQQTQIDQLRAEVAALRSQCAGGQPTQ